MTVRLPRTDPQKDHCRFWVICSDLIPHSGSGFLLLAFFFKSDLALYCKYTQYSKIYTTSVNITMIPVTVLNRLSLCVTVCIKGQYYNNVSATQR